MTEDEMQEKMEKLWFQAVKVGRSEILETMLSCGVDINTVNQYEESSALHFALKENLTNVAKYLISAGIDVNLKNQSKTTAMSNAIICLKEPTETCEIIKLLIDAGASVNDFVDHDEATALHLAAKYKKVDVLKYLLSLGADVNLKSRGGSAALHYAAMYDTYDHRHYYYYSYSDDLKSAEAKKNLITKILEALLTANADVNAKNKNGETALHILAKNYSMGKFSEAHFELLIKYNANIYALDEDNFTPMDYALQIGNLPELIKLLIRHGVDVNSGWNSDNGKGYSLLHRAIMRNNLPIVKFLIKNGANLDFLDSKGEPPLRLVLNYSDDRSESRIVMLNYILSWYPDVNIIMHDGTNLLQKSEDGQIYNLYTDDWKIMLQHFAKIQCLGYLLHDEILKTIAEKSNYAKYFKSCVNELNTLKKIKLGDSLINFYRLLMDDKHKLFKYAGNQKLVKIYKYIDVAKAFRCYGPSIHDRFVKAWKKRSTLNKSAQILSTLLPIKNSAYFIAHHILSFMSTKDMSVLLRVEQTSTSTTRPSPPF